MCEIPKEISNLIELEELDLRSNSSSGSLDMELTFNNLSGSLPPNIVSILPNIEQLFLDGLTNLVGTIPHSISNCSKLNGLVLSNNQLTGLILNSPEYLTHLQLLNLGGNYLTSYSSSSFLTSLTNCRNLTFLVISFNPLNDMLPASTGNLSTSLRKFYTNNCKIKGNKFTGFIGDHICKLQHLGGIYLGQNQLSGSFPNCLGNITSLMEIHLGSNKLSSNIPPSLGNLPDLVALDLSSNNMVGSLPPEIGNLKAITVMDLSMNQLSNEIPREIGGLQNLAYLSLRHNKLQGAIPDSMSNMAVIVPMAFVLLWISNLIGSGSFGSVYKGVLRSGTTIAVKVFNLDAAFKSFDTECEVLRSLRHRNLVKVITSCSNLDFKALVLEYIPNGSLEKYLYSHNYFLDIKQRLSIMIDVACALEYLHHGCSSPVIHYDVKPSNVLLDEDMVAHLSDFGISKFLGEDESDLYTKTLATLGYIAPEYGQDGLVSTKCDVYSYGIMLLETFTRRKTNNFERDLSLKQWVSHSLSAVMDVIDIHLVTPTGNHLWKDLDVVASIMKVALDCCAESPTRRTNMKDVVGMLQKIKIQLLAF
ncbi:hypothetical protein P3S68_003280 [Capsicum galapagoense]